MQVVKSVTSPDGTSIAFDRAGSGPAVILVDAALGFRGFGPMTPLAAVLAPHFTVFTYDRRGRGESSDTLPYDVEREVDDLQALIDAAGGSAFVYAYSSGTALALHAAMLGLPIPKLALLEPPLDLDDEPAAETDLERTIAELVAAGRRGDAVEHFHRDIGVPDEYLVGMREAPSWPAMVAAAHTLVYDLIVCRTLPLAELSSMTTPTLVLASEASDERLRGWAQGLSDALPNASFRALKGEWHGVAPEDVAPVLAEFFGGEFP